MSRRDHVLVRHREAIKAAAAGHKAESILLVGSVARGEDTEDSDCDFLVEFADNAGLFDVCGLSSELEDILGRKVDVIDFAGRGERRELILSSMLHDAVPL